MGTIKTTNIEPIANNGTVTLGSSGDTFTFASGVTGTSYPAFEAYLSSDQSISNLTVTKVQFDTEVFDSNSAYDNSSNYRFTPQVAGKYFVYTNIQLQDAAFNIQQHNTDIYKNGSIYRNYTMYVSPSEFAYHNSYTSAIIDLNGSSDYVEIFTLFRQAGGTPVIDAPNKCTYFGAYRIGT